MSKEDRRTELQWLAYTDSQAFWMAFNRIVPRNRRFAGMLMIETMLSVEFP